MGVSLFTNLVRTPSGPAQDQIPGQVLAGFPAVEGVGISGELDISVLGRCVRGQADRGRKSPQSRNDRGRVDPRQGDPGVRLIQNNDGFVHGLAVALEGQCPAVGVQETDPHRGGQGALCPLTRGWRGHLGQVEDQGLPVRVIGVLEVNLRRAGLFVPGEEA